MNWGHQESSNETLEKQLQTFLKHFLVNLSNFSHKTPQHKFGEFLKSSLRPSVWSNQKQNSPPLHPTNRDTAQKASNIIQSGKKKNVSSTVDNTKNGTPCGQKGTPLYSARRRRAHCPGLGVRADGAGRKTDATSLMGTTCSLLRYTPLRPWMAVRTKSACRRKMVVDYTSSQWGHMEGPPAGHCGLTGPGVGILPTSCDDRPGKQRTLTLCWAEP